MAQYDVFRNPSKVSRDEVPYVVVIQSELLDHLPTRLVLPLGQSDSAMPRGPAALSPALEFQGQSLRVLPHLAAAFRVRDLGKSVGSLSHCASQLVAAVDSVISGY
jgi:toxin CcdB